MKKLFTLLMLSLVATGLYATIHLTEVYEQVYVNSPRSYDIDADGDDDFSFTAVDPTPSTGSASFYVTALKPTSYYAAESSGGERPKAYTEGAAYGLHILVSDTGLLASPGDGNFRNSTKYLQVRFSDGTKNLSGWFLLDKTGSSNLEVISFAYSDVDGDTIAAGEVEPAVGIREVNPAVFNITNFTQSNIAFENCTAYDKVRIYTIDGKTIAQIDNPVAFRNYVLNSTNGQVLVAFFKEEKLLFTGKRFVN